ncbi:hypothetical protein PHMEG_00018479, partial [Phytophthora megakarya]
RRRYICTHGWPDRSRGKGDRPQQNHRRLQCPFRFTAESVYVKMSWKVKIRHPFYTNNHSFGVSFYLPPPASTKTMDTLYKLSIPVSQDDEVPPFVKISGLDTSHCSRAAQ